MNTRLLIRIPHVPYRVDIDEMIRRLEGPGVRVHVIVEPEPYEEGAVVPSLDRLDRAIKTVSRAWAPPYEEGFAPTHVLVLEDDGVLPEDAGTAMRHVCETWPTNPIGFFCARHFARYAYEEHGSNYAIWERFCGGVAQCLPVVMAAAFHKWTSSPTFRYAHMPVDGRVNQFLSFLRSSPMPGYETDVVFPAPSIVDHDSTIGSVAGGSKKPVCAPLALGPNVSALEHRWGWWGEGLTMRVYRGKIEDNGPLVREPNWVNP